MYRLTSRQKGRVLASGLVAAGMLLLGGILAPGAQAATISVTIDCTNTAQDITAAQGDTVVVTAGPACLAGGVAQFFAVPGGTWTWSDYFSDPLALVTGTTNTYNIQPNAPLGQMPFANNRLPYICKNCAPYAPMRFTITTPSQSDSGSNAGGPDLTIQQKAIGKTASMTSCPTGWGESWQYWAVPVTGGAVCVADFYAYTPWIPLPGQPLPSSLG